MTHYSQLITHRSSLLAYGSCFLLTLILFSFTGCFRDIILNPESVEKHSNRNIVVTTKEGNKIKFKNGEFQIITDTLGIQTLTGKGKIYNTNNSSFIKSFEGSISLNEIKTISACCDTTPWLYVTIAGLSVAVVSLAYMALQLQGRGFGG
jgi:hypothetical protein